MEMPLTIKVYYLLGWDLEGEEDPLKRSPAKRAVSVCAVRVWNPICKLKRM